MSSYPQRTYLTLPRFTVEPALQDPEKRRRRAEAAARLQVNTTHPPPPARPPIDSLDWSFVRETERRDAAAAANLNKALPPLPGQRPDSRRGSGSDSPTARAAHWINKKVVTPVKEFFQTPEVTEMIYSSHGTGARVMKNGSPARAFASQTPSYDTHPPSPSSRSSNRQRGRSPIDHETSSSSQRAESVASRTTYQSVRSHIRSSSTSISNNVRDAAQKTGSKFGLVGREGGRLEFSDAAPPGMMDPCRVCGKEVTGVLYKGRCREC